MSGLIKIDYEDLELKIGGCSYQSKVLLTEKPTPVQISSKSQVMTEYRLAMSQIVSLLEQYQRLLENDIQALKSAKESMQEADRAMKGAFE